MDALVEEDIDHKQHTYMVKHFKGYRKLLKQAHIGAREWWEAQIGRYAISGKGNVDMMKVYMANEFDIELDSMNPDDDYGFDITVRKKK